MKKTFLSVVSGVSMTLLLVGCGQENVASFPESAASYDQVNQEIGCKSDLSDDKKDAIFNKKYRDHWVEWDGKVVLYNPEEASVDADSSGAESFTVKFEDDQAGYDLSKGDDVSIRFLLRRAGGCVLPFSGDHGSVQ